MNVLVYIPANVYFNVLIYICMNVPANALMCAFSVHCLRMCSCVSGLRFAHIAAAHGFAHICTCAAALLRFRVRSPQRSQKESCGELRSRTELCFRICKRRGRRLHKAIRSQTHVDVHANVDARSVAFSRARPLCGQSLPLLPIATAGAQNAPASLLVSLRSQKEKAAVKNSCKVPLEERIRILIRIHIRILIFIRIRIKISSIFVL